MAQKIQSNHYQRKKQLFDPEGFAEDKKAEEELAQRRKEAEKLAAATFGTDEGKRMLAIMCVDCGFLSTIGRGESVDYMSGQRDVYIGLRHLLRNRFDILNEVERMATESMKAENNG